MSDRFLDLPGRQAPRVAWRRSLFAACLRVALACAGTFAASPANAADTPSALGALIFHDASLSASGRMSCATCHDPAHAHAPANALAVQAGGTDLDVPGFRAVPSLRYLDL